MSSELTTRLFAAAGLPAPIAGTPLVRTLTRAPRDRLIRVVAWYAWECGRGLPSESHLFEGIRVLIRGWDDFYPTIALRSGVPLVNIEGPGVKGEALVMRRERVGRGWVKEAISMRGEVRPEIELATCWLGSLVGCIVHDDCAANPALGLACSGTA